MAGASTRGGRLVGAPPAAVRRLVLPGLARLARDPTYIVAILAALPVVALLAALTPAQLSAHTPPLRAALLLIVAAPVLEEIVFRAGFHDWIAGYWGGGWGALSAANTATAVLFAVLHLLRHPPGWALATAAPALAFGYFYERHERCLIAPILLHASYNAAYLVLLI